MVHFIFGSRCVGILRNIGHHYQGCQGVKYDKNSIRPHNIYFTILSTVKHISSIELYTQCLTARYVKSRIATSHSKWDSQATNNYAENPLLIK